VTSRGATEVSPNVVRSFVQDTSVNRPSSYTHFPQTLTCTFPIFTSAGSIFENRSR
jgi:hypothetical protein